MRAKKQFVFVFWWSALYSLIFNFNKATFIAPKAFEIVMAYGWVFLLFLVSTYSRIFFFSVIPIVFLTSGVVAYAEWLMHTQISRDVVMSTFQSNWQELYGLTGSVFWVWFCTALFLAILCVRHLLKLKLKHHGLVKFIITSGFIFVFWICTDLIFRPFYGYERNIFHWQHPYDYFEYTTNFIKEAMAISKLENKYNLASVPSKLNKPPGYVPLQVVVIIGEAARADHFGIYGYARNTTPFLLKEKNLLPFNDVSSCGTTTRTSVPCLMTRATRENLKPSKEETSFISLFKKLGFSTFWVSEQAKFSGINTVVSSIANEAETSVFQDNTLDLKLKEFKAYFFNELQLAGNEKLSVFHMIGSHFPYHWMYPSEFRHFVPTCPASALDPLECTGNELVNTYDNTIVYADYFLARTIEALKDKNAIMIYVADHGEFLGEGGKYLHGQETGSTEVRHVPMIGWASDLFIRLYPDKVRAMRSKLQDKLSHDHVFHSVLDCAGIESPVIDKALSVCR